MVVKERSKVKNSTFELPDGFLRSWGPKCTISYWKSEPVCLVLGINTMIDNKSAKEVCVLMGGNSSEREVSLRSGNNVYEALTESDKPFTPVNGEFSHPRELLDLLIGTDLVFNCLHGGIGEDGTVQTLLELLNIPYTGTGSYGSALAMDKLYSKKSFRRAGINIPDYIEIGESEEIDKKEITNALGFPVVVKPVSEGSSRGIKIVDDEEEMIQAVAEIRKNYGGVFIEEYIAGKEITAGILEFDGQLTALPLVELNVTEERFFNYEAKYTPGNTEFIVPARLSDAITDMVKDLAMKAHRAHHCRGYSRVDFRVDLDGDVYALEVNTLPGMTKMSDLPFAASYAGISFQELVENMVSSVL